jgi:hypothetical protein
MENRYWLFSGENYYPLGGMEDFIKASSNLDEIKSHIDSLECDSWAHIYDYDENRIILYSKDVGNYPASKYIWIGGLVDGK